MARSKEDRERKVMSKRLYNCPKKIIGLTGGIATGKTTFTKILQDSGHDVICADKLVKDIYKKEESINFIKKNAPAAIEQEKIVFSKLRTIFFNDKNLKIKIENFVYGRLEQQFNLELEHIKSDVLIYDVPLLFEKKLNTLVDASVLIYSPKNIQVQRLCKRDQISPELAQKIISSQIPIEQKKAESDLIINNTGSLNELLTQYKSKFIPFLKELI